MASVWKKSVRMPPIRKANNDPISFRRGPSLRVESENIRRGETTLAFQKSLTDDLNSIPIRPLVIPVVGVILDRQLYGSSGELGQFSLDVKPFVSAHRL